jgi:hypothetical protein
VRRERPYDENDRSRKPWRGSRGCEFPEGLPRAAGKNLGPLAREPLVVGAVPPITFHYDHSTLAGSYPDGMETVAIESLVVPTAVNDCRLGASVSSATASIFRPINRSAHQALGNHVPGSGCYRVY